MAKFICYHKPSLFLQCFESFTQKLFILSQVELNLPLRKKVFNPKTWTTSKKQATCDKSFEKKPESACKILWEDPLDTEHSMAMMKFTTSLKLNIQDTTYNMTPPIGSANNRKLQEDDGSTIFSSKSIPANINVVDNKYITGRKYRTSGNPQKITQT